MEDTRMKDRRAPYLGADGRMHTPSEAEVAAGIASPQHGSQPWMNRPAGLTEDQYKTLVDIKKALYTAEEIEYLSTMAAVAEYKQDPILYLIKWQR